MLILNNKKTIKKGHVLLFCCLALIFFTMGGVPGAADAQGKVKPEWKMPKHYPNGFDGMGYINRIAISDGEVVIDDVLYIISSDAKYSTPTFVDASTAFFTEGVNVGFIVNSKKIITSLWAIED